jgi:hypothetical protein
MRRTTAWFVLVGAVVFGSAGPVRADDGFWVSVASGTAGSATPSNYQEWWFETPHGPPPIAVTRMTASGNAEATTAGGSSFFTGGAVPVVLKPTDGYAYLASENRPSDLSQALRRQMAGGKTLASALPDATATVPPPGSLLLTVDQAAAKPNGSSPLTVSLTDQAMNAIGSASVDVPSGGWWVIGLGPNPNDPTTTPPPTTPPPTTPPPTTPPPTTPPPTTPPPTTDPGGPVATPEPATALLAGFGGLGAYAWRLLAFRRRRMD